MKKSTVALAVALVACAVSFAAAASNVTAKDKELCASQWPNSQAECLQARAYYNGVMNAKKAPNLPDSPEGFDYTKYLEEEMEKINTKERLLMVAWAREQRTAKA